eukprot:SAG11_NODE_68_length_18649_cov_29.058005_14_plen_601_part_00
MLVHIVAHVTAAYQVSTSKIALSDVSSDSGSWDSVSGVSSIDEEALATERRCWILFSFLLAPGLVVLVVAWYRFYSDNFTLSRFVQMSLLVLQAPLLVGIIASAYASQSWEVALSLSFCDALFMFLIIICGHYFSNDFTLATWARWSAAALLISAVVVSIAVGGWLDGLEMFWSVTVGWWAFVGVLALLSSGLKQNGFHESIRGGSRYIHYSDFVLPAFAYDAEEKKVVSICTAVVCRYCAGIGLLFWAITASIFVAPSWIGALVMALVILEMWSFSLHVRQSSILRFGAALAKLQERIPETQDLINIVDEARAAARADQEETLQEIIRSEVYAGRSYPRLAELLVDKNGQLLEKANEIVTALAAQEIGGDAALHQLSGLEKNLWSNVNDLTMFEQTSAIDHLLRMDRMSGLFFNLELRCQALVRMIIEHISSNCTSDDSSLLVLEDTFGSPQVELGGEGRGGGGLGEDEAVRAVRVGRRELHSHAPSPLSHAYQTFDELNTIDACLQVLGAIDPSADHAPANVQVRAADGLLHVAWDQPPVLRVSAGELVEGWMVRLSPGGRSPSHHRHSREIDTNYSYFPAKSQHRPIPRLALADNRV